MHSGICKSIEREAPWRGSVECEAAETERKTPWTEAVEGEAVETERGVTRETEGVAAIWEFLKETAWPERELPGCEDAMGTLRGGDVKSICPVLALFY